MITIFSHTRATVVIAILVSCILILTKCIDHGHETKKERIKNASGMEYAGSESCRNCHKPIYDSFSTTMHHLASGSANKDYIKGSFAGNENTFAFDRRQKVVMEEQGDDLFQTAYVDGEKVRSERFDVVIGSGKKGQTYLYWKSNELYQLPISYFANVHSWINNPGYSTRAIYYDRNIEGRCMECHTTFAKERLDFGYYKDQIMYGIDCERCHGAAAQHVDFHQEHPQEKQGKFIVNPGSLTRQQKLDVCAVCHSGVMETITPAFSFHPGDTLSKYFVRNFSGADSLKLDVHANQYGLLTASKCFRISENMSCGTCHNPHTKETGNLTVYAQKCMSCHSTTNHNFCKLQPAPGFSLETNCVNCHMPVRASDKIVMAGADQALPSRELVRSHLIAVYPDQTKKWMK